MYILIIPFNIGSLTSFVHYKRFVNPAFGHEVDIAVNIALPYRDWIFLGVKFLQWVHFFATPNN